VGELNKKEFQDKDPGTLFSILDRHKLWTSLSAAILFLLVRSNGVRGSEQEYLYSGIYLGSLVCWKDGGKIFSYTDSSSEARKFSYTGR
jgi:hypothetical protein